jgi:hypothetical protein
LFSEEYIILYLSLRVIILYDTSGKVRLKHLQHGEEHRRQPSHRGTPTLFDISTTRVSSEPHNTNLTEIPLHPVRDPFPVLRSFFPVHTEILTESTYIRTDTTCFGTTENPSLPVRLDLEERAGRSVLRHHRQSTRQLALDICEFG